MKKRLINRTTALLLACLMFFSMTYNPVMAAETEITISSVEEFIDFTQKCSLDTWSQGKTIRLTVDLDLTGTDFTSIPTFGGTFLGNGHTITGLYLTGSGSNQGLFRYIQSGGIVSDLKVKGTVQPGGSCTNVGGITGSNSGIIQKCEFQGTVKGNTAVGGIAGINHETGQMNGCSVFGTVQGENGTGGIVGKNLGIVMKCKNAASINIAENSTAPDADTDTEDTLQQLADTDIPEALLDRHTDTGGLVGYSSGIVQSCTNIGTVGYPHVGYNVGGIAGRQTGYLSGCVNSGKVLGRKDVGGIAGQAEPYIAMTPGGDAFDNLRRELDTLDGLIAQALEDADAANDDLSARLTSMGKITDNARDSSKRLADSSADFINNNIGALNSISVILVNALDNLAPAVDELENTAHWLNLMISELEEGLKDLELPSEDEEVLNTAIQELRAAYDDMQNASTDLKTAFAKLVDALIRNDDAGIEAAMGEVRSTLIKLGGAYREAGDAFGDISELLKTIQPDMAESTVPENAVTVSGNETEPMEPIQPDGEMTDELQNILYQMAEALEESGISWPGSLVDWEKVQSALSDVSDALDKGVSAASNFGSAAEAFFAVLSNSIDVESAKNHFAAAAEHAGSMSRSLEKAFETLADVVRKLSNEGPVEFAALGEETRTASGDLYAALGDLSTQIQALNTSMQSNGDVLTADIRAISHQFNVVFDVLLDSMSNLRDSERKDAEDYIQDTSDEDIAATRLGKVADCRSTGTVEGDRNVGGILGSMAIEYDLDPEDDIKHFSLGNTYELKVVLENCVNNGKVTGKKDCVGGLVGRMDLGTAIDGQNYGAVESADGNYVGGAIGWSDGSIRRCYAKCTLSGGDYVGGLAGWTDRLTDSCAIVTVLDGTEFVGAVAGDADLEEGVIRNNSFVDTGIAAIDGISYTDRAVPAAFEDLKKQEGIPIEFVSFTLTLLADGETVAKIPFLYGNDLSLIELPEVPMREGEYGKWPDFDTSGLKSDITLEAVYAPWVTVVDSVEKDGKLSRALAEGSFTEETKLHVTDGEGTPPVEDICVVWKVELSGTNLTDSDEVPLRLLNKVGRKAEVWQIIGGEWKQIDVTRSGQYLLLTMTGTTGTFCICEGTNDGMTVIWLFIILTVFLLVSLICVKHRRRKQVVGKNKK